MGKQNNSKAFNYRINDEITFKGNVRIVGNNIESKVVPICCTPTFVNLKSNTMKNTLQRYGFSRYLQAFRLKSYVL